MTNFKFPFKALLPNDDTRIARASFPGPAPRSNAKSRPSEVKECCYVLEDEYSDGLCLFDAAQLEPQQMAEDPTQLDLCPSEFDIQETLETQLLRCTFTAYMTSQHSIDRAEVCMRINISWILYILT
jgi:hypothetical protein